LRTGIELAQFLFMFRRNLILAAILSISSTGFANDSDLLCSLLTPEDPQRLGLSQLLKQPFGEVRASTSQTFYAGELSFLNVPLSARIQRPDATTSDGQRLQKLIDRMTKTIYQTPTGSRLIKAASWGYQNHLSLILGVSPQEEARYREFYQWSRLGLRQLPKSSTLPSSFSRYTFLYENMPGDLTFDGWTDQRSQTFITVRGTNLQPICNASTNLHFIRTFAHELARVGDDKAEPLPFFQFHALLKSGGDPCRSYAAMAHPLIQLAASSARAFRTEDKIAQELGFPVQQQAEGRSCSELLSAQLSSATDFEAILLDDWNSRLLETQKSCPITFENLNLQEIFNILETERIATSASTEMTLCQYLMTPSFDHPGYRRNGGRGPRPPRVGDGTGRASSMDSRQLNDLSLQLSEKNRQIQTKKQITKELIPSDENVKLPTQKSAPRDLMKLLDDDQ
jgi:hypothetical protein